MTGTVCAKAGQGPWVIGLWSSLHGWQQSPLTLDVHFDLRGCGNPEKHAKLILTTDPELRAKRGNTGFSMPAGALISRKLGSMDG